MRKKRPGEVICRCGSYPFPHRMMGGACTGAAIVAAVFAGGPFGKCKGCMLLEEHVGEMLCQALDGRERMDACPELAELIQYEGVKLYGVNRPPPKRMGWRR